jgi:hypothetical protein
MRALLAVAVAVSFGLFAAEQPSDQNACTRAEQLLAKDAASAKEADLDRRLSSSRHIDAGRKLLADLEYELAYKQFQQALADDPRNTEARRLKEQVEALMGVHPARMHTAIEQLVDEHKVNIEEQKAVIANTIDEARKHIKRAETDPDLDLVQRLREYQNALDLLLRVKELLNYLPADNASSTINRQLSELLQMTETKSKIVETRRKEIVREEATRESAERCKRR